MLSTKSAMLNSMVIQEIISLPKIERTRRHLDILDELLRKHDIISKYTKELRYLLYDIMTYQVFPANKFVTIQGRLAKNQYLILNGIARNQTMPPVSISLRAFF